MAKATLTLANGTVVEIDGSAEEVKTLLEFYSGSASADRPARRKRPTKKSARPTPQEKEPSESDTADLTAIVNEVKSCDEAEAIEERVLDKASQIDRTLLPLYIVHEYFDNQHALSSGEISKITTQLSVPVSQPNASRTLSGTASKYVIGDTTRKKGFTVRYKLNRRGVKYLKSVVSGDSGE